jgi:hypothetical protein
MSTAPDTDLGAEEEREPGERLSFGVAARLSRYLQVLTQAHKMGKDTISSQELSAYTHINSTQIRRDLSGFGKFGKRGVGYRIDYLTEEIKRILRTVGNHRIALFGAGKLGQAIAESDIFADHGFDVVAMFDVNPGDRRALLGGPGGRRRPGRGGGDGDLQLHRSAARGPARGDGPHLQPGRRPPVRPLLLPLLNHR